MPHILFTLFFLLTAIIANEDHLIIEAENKAIEAILKAEKNIAIEPIEDKKLTAVLSIISTILLQEKADQVTDFSQLTTFTAGPKKGLEGIITDNDGIISVKIEYSNGSVTNYVNGNINSESVYNSGTTYTITVTDDNGVVKTKTGTL